MLTQPMSLYEFTKEQLIEYIMQLEMEALLVEEYMEEYK